MSLSRRSTVASNVGVFPLDKRPSFTRRRTTLLSGDLQAAATSAGPAQTRPGTTASLRLGTRNAAVALQCWTLPANEGGDVGSGTKSNLLERAVSSISLTAGVPEEGADGDFLRRGSPYFLLLVLPHNDRASTWKGLHVESPTVNSVAPPRELFCGYVSKSWVSETATKIKNKQY